MNPTSTAGPTTEFVRQLFSNAALVLAVVAGGASLLLAGGLQAATANFHPWPPFGTPVTDNCASIQGDHGPIPFTSEGFVEFASIGPSPLNGRPTWQIKTDFNPNLQGGYFGLFAYSLRAPAGERWVSAGLSQQIIPVNPSVNPSIGKQIYGDRSISGPVNLLLTLGPISNSSSTTIMDFVSPDDDGVIFVVDTYFGLPTAQLDAFVNVVQTPGPLPVLGAGTVFGLSRKLRGRIQAARRS